MERYYAEYFPAVPVARFYERIGTLADRGFSYGHAPFFGALAAEDLRSVLVDHATRYRDRDGDYHVGAVYPWNYAALRMRKPKEASMSSYVMRKELVIDIDMSDDREWRTRCGCAESNPRGLCDPCFRRLGCIVHTILHTWKTVTGETAIEPLCVFSGGRGAHLYISEAPYVDMPSWARKTFLSVMQMHPTYDPAVKQAAVDEGVWPDKIYYDAKVTGDPYHFVRGLYSPHASGYIATPVSPEALLAARTPADIAVRVRPLVDAREQQQRECELRKLERSVTYLNQWLDSNSQPPKLLLST
jgi:hypothetical protein